MDNSTLSNSKYHVEIRDCYGVVVGDHNTLIFKNYPSLAESYLISFEYLITEHTKGSTERRWVFEAVDNFIALHSCGYFPIVADAGLGKTTIAAQLATQHQAITHFFNASVGITRTDQCLNNLSAQLIARYDLGYDSLPEAAGQSSHFLAVFGNLIIDHPEIFWQCKS